MKTKEELEKLTENLYPISPNPNQVIEGFERVAFKKGYLQCQEDVTDKKYTEEDMRKAIGFGYELRNNHKPINSGIDWVKEFNSLNKHE